MAFFKLDDFSGSCECIMFSKVFTECEDLIKVENTVLVQGRLESSGDAIKLHADEAIPLSSARGKLTKRLAIQLEEGTHEKGPDNKDKRNFITTRGNNSGIYSG